MDVGHLTWRAQCCCTLLFCLSSSGMQAEEPAETIAHVRVFAVYEPVLAQQDVDILARVHPDFICRGWFKWHNTPDWSQYAPRAEACAKKGILLQGGITLSAVYPNENKMDEATFRAFTAHGTDGQPYPCRMADSGGWYQLSLYNPKVIDYLKRQVHLQIDAGAVGIWYDEIEGIYDWNPTEGYDAYACAAFRDWLIRKYCTGQGWRDDDPRWQTQFSIDLSKHGGSIRTFDYLRHLHATLGKNGQPLADNPAQGFPRNWATSANPLYREWGFAWDRKATGTFRFDTVAAIFADILADANRYAHEKYGRTLINTYNHNGTARPGVAFLQPHNGAQPPLRHGRLDGRVSYLPYYETLIADAAEVCPGQPVVFFVDWPGETDRLTALPRTDQLTFFSIYIPEAYAAGGEFALPLRGYSYVAAHQGTLAMLTRMADFYRAYAPFLRSSQPLPSQPEQQERLTLRTRTSPAGTTVHLVNHAFSTREVKPLPQTNLCVRIPWTMPAPATAFAVSPDYPEQRPVPFTVKDGILTLTLRTVTCSALVIFPNEKYLHTISGKASEGCHILAAQGSACAPVSKGAFTLWISSATTTLECLETGESLPAREGVTFVVPPADQKAKGLLLDRFGIPMRHAELLRGEQKWHTDNWGRFRIPHSADTSLSVISAEHTTNTITISDSFTAYRLSPTHVTLSAFDASQDGYWANWPDKEKNPAVITLACEKHHGIPALKCTFAPAPHVPWSNINSPALNLAHADALAITFAGDGTARTLDAVLHAYPNFYRAPLSLTSTTGLTYRIPFSAFRDSAGQAFDATKYAGLATFQLASPSRLDTPVTVWLQRVERVCTQPVKQLWQQAAPFDAVDVENRAAEHRPQVPPPAIAQRKPLVRFADATTRYLANWSDKEGNPSHPMVIIEQQTRTPAAPIVRITLPAGDCAWGNANIPLPHDALIGKDGLILRLCNTPITEDISLALHTTINNTAVFFHADVEGAAALTEYVLPWSEFRTDKGVTFTPHANAFVNLQICRPAQNLSRTCVIELESVDCFTKKEYP